MNSSNANLPFPAPDRRTMNFLKSLRLNSSPIANRKYLTQ